MPRKPSARGWSARVVPAKKLMDEAMSAAGKIAEKSQITTKAVKESVSRAYEGSLREGLLFERRMFHMMFASEDRAEGMQAFLEKRTRRNSAISDCLFSFGWAWPIRRPTCAWARLRQDLTVVVFGQSGPLREHIVTNPKRRYAHGKYTPIQKARPSGGTPHRHQQGASLAHPVVSCVK